MSKFCFKGDHTIATGKKIIEKLISFGGENVYNLSGYGNKSFCYYFITVGGKIDVDNKVPQGYQLKIV